ncbi:hypothetical protein BLD25_00660 [Candidatus Gracilibacteria bacterium GN02-872]|nr:hypothetical protein BLD25_00660 [Candidatus Gracilibacteria bacterium GN02-872]
MKKKLITFLILTFSIFSFTENTFSAKGSYCNAGDAFCLEQKAKDEVKVTSTLDQIIENWVVYLLGFIFLVSVIYGLYGATHIFGAGADEEKVQKGKKIIIRAIVGIAVTFVAYPIVRFVIGDEGKTNSGLFQSEGL